MILGKAEEEAAARLYLGEVVDKEVAVVLVVEVLAMVPLDMEDLLMMEEERGRPFQLLVCQTHPLSSYSLTNPIWFRIRVPQ